MSVPQLLAQLYEQNPGLYVFGPLGIVCSFFMLASVKLYYASKEESAALRGEIRGLAHCIDGLQRALLAELVERETVGVATKSYALRQIARIDARLPK